MKRAPAIAVAVVMIVSMLAMPLGAAVATAQAGPSGMVALGPDQVDEDLPSDADVPIRASDLEGNVYASDHAGSLQITVTTPERAGKYMGDNANVVADDDIAIVLADDEVHEGRDVAVDIGVLEAGIGYVPDVAYGVHDSGEEWQSPIEQEDGVGRFHVDKFSSNSVTFSGGIELSGTAAGDGTNYQYELDNLNGVEDYAINLTGVDNAAWGNMTVTSAQPTHTTSLSVGGNQPPTDGDGASPKLVVEAANDKAYDLSSLSRDGQLGPNANGMAFSEDGTTFIAAQEDTSGADVDQYSLSTPYDLSTASHVRSANLDDSDGMDALEVADGGKKIYITAWADGTYEYDLGTAYDISTATLNQKSSTILSAYGTEMGHNGEYIFGSRGGGDVQKHALDTPYDTSSGSSSTHTIPGIGGTISGMAFDDDGDRLYVMDGAGYVREYDLDGPYEISTATETTSVDVSTELNDQNLVGLELADDGRRLTIGDKGAQQYTIGELPKSISVDTDTGASHTFGDIGGDETKTAHLDVTDSTSELAFSGSGGNVDYKLVLEEHTQTTDPVVEVNGYTTEYNGVLSEGETTSLATNEAWLQEGTNNVTIRTNTPSNGPESLVDLTYSHDASGVTKSVDVEATSWTESFNVSHTFPSAVADADATLTFDEQVAEIHDVEYRIDGGDWQAPPSYELNGTDLHVGLGDVSADTDIDVRATGHKVRAYDGAVKVTEPTVEGDDLSTEVKITDINPDGMFGLRVDETVLGDRLHYASEESWTGESAHAELTSSGTQILRAPDANEGSTMRVSTAPVSVSPSSGAIEAEVEDSSEPTFSLRKGNTTGSDRIEVTYYNTVTGDRYVLWSETREVEVDADRAESPVNFVTDGSSETYSILQRDAGSQIPGGSPRGPTGQENTFSLILAFAGIGGVLVGSTLVSRKFDIGGWLLPVTATSLTAVAMQVLSPGSPLLRVAQLASESNAVTIGAVAALLIGMWQLDERTSGKVPWYVRGVIGVLSVVWALETISPGVILGGLRSGVESMGPLIVIVIVGGGAYLVREWIQARKAPDTVVEFQAGEQ